ncbi:SufS family cysteine desulfurase [Labrys sp. KNU-23]|uniref:family 2A encapsulin nanocompartment cargo protein cysteine desulfurase n=1 Tax=Labrys sp. KNU-23 TaxID=2789216 RepID=UPI0011EBE2E2|nr:family 2A encapsulin nanocompartment cargo protein cysteine desulfurase [Labrys sp. KNU-23]QEN88651.1 SufS family cysteine desulfurase [Labrys sp. KNU-23]
MTTGISPNPSWPDPTVLADLANALFQAPPGQGTVPLAPTVPAVPPSPTLAPAPSITTSVAPQVPARPPVGPPDLPPVTIPSIVPTPTIPIAPATAPQPLSGASAIPSDVPQPGGSAGPFVPAVPTQLDFSVLPAGIAEFLSLLRPDVAAAAPLQAPSTASVPGSIAQPSQDGYYFLRDGQSLAPSQPPAPPVAAPPSVPPVPQRPPSVPTQAAVSAAPRLPDFSAVTLELRPDAVPDLAQSGRPFDANSVKRDFPILQTQVHGKPLIWLDNAATTQKPQAVIDRLSHFYEHENSNIHRAAHALAARATDAYEGAREKVRRFLNAGSTRDIIFVRGTTEGINLIAQAYGRRHVGEGDEILVTWLEHHANIVPWQMLAAEKGARLRVAPVDDSGQVILEEYEKLINPRTRIVSITQVSNALGTVTPAREMVAIAKRHGATVVVDGAQSVSHMRTDVQALDADFFVFSGHKVFGPTGIGVVHGKPDVLAHLPPWQGGGNMIADVTFEKTIYHGPPERFEAGTGNIADAVGLGAALDYVETIGMDVIGRYEHELLVYATEHMLTVPGLKLIGTARDKASVLSFVLDGCRTQDVGVALDREGIAVRAGHHCAQPILRRFGLESTVRPSLAFYNTYEDVDALVAALRRIQSGRGYL